MPTSDIIAVVAVIVTIISVSLTAFVTYLHTSVRASITELELRLIDRISISMKETLDAFNGRYVYSKLFESRMAEVDRRFDEINERLSR